MKRIPQSLRAFFAQEVAGGIFLCGAAALALVLANSPLSDSYLSFSESSSHFVNEFLMAIFFFLVGLEIKREFIYGELRDPKKAALPIIAALGGMAVPAIIWALFTSGGPGWAIAMPTDIALALGALALLGSRIDTSLKIFLLTLAISDDLFSIIVLGTFYSSSLSFVKIASTIGAVVLAFLIPTGDSKRLDRLIAWIHPWSAFFIVPLFALVNIGVVIDFSTLPTTLTSPIALALIIGRPVGKLIGITLFAWLAIKFKIAHMPASLSFKEIAGAGALAGMGLTVSLFIAELALDDSASLDQVRVGLIVGAIISALLGISILRKFSFAQD
jgi:NhaA family Na+:H+ antiporter